MDSQHKIISLFKDMSMQINRDKVNTFFDKNMQTENLPDC